MCAERAVRVSVKMMAMPNRYRSSKSKSVNLYGDDGYAQSVAVRGALGGKDSSVQYVCGKGGSGRYGRCVIVRVRAVRE
jgi:hypothetical protein